jgi:hypothetical protein
MQVSSKRITSPEKLVENLHRAGINVRARLLFLSLPHVQA